MNKKCTFKKFMVSLNCGLGETVFPIIICAASNEEHQNDTMPPPTKKPLTVLEESTDSIGDGTSADVSQPVKKDAGKLYCFLSSFFSMIVIFVTFFILQVCQW